MDAERWQHIQGILADLLELPEAARAQALRQRCGDDEDLRAEVESLLAASAEATTGGFLDSTDEVRPGDVISHYRVDGSIGRGGMGEVYRATDMRLGRQVALKVLPAHLAGDAAHVNRFKREARLLASLNHPNIASIYDVEETGERKVLVLELVEGQTIADRLEARKGRGIEIDACLRWARQIAGAVEAAHEVGIVHRDLKPANVKIGTGDRVKVLDFGIAKPELAQLADAPVGAAGEQPPQLTQVGHVVGTVSYMSPEALRGERVDRRTDVWAFGCLLYEMLTGMRAFAAGDTSSTQSLILGVDPDWSRLPEGLPARVRALLERALCKDPRQRLQAIGEARIVLDRVLAGEPEGAPAPAPARRGVPTWAAALLALAVALAVWMLRPDTPPPASRVQRLQLLAHPLPATPMLSPDGSMISYVHDNLLWIYSLESLADRALPVERAFARQFSPNSDAIAYIGAGRLQRVSLASGESTFIAEVPPGTNRVAWGQPDRVVLAGAGGLFEADIAGGGTRLLMPLGEGEGPTVDAHVAPNGAVLFVTASLDRIDAWVGDQRKTVVDAPGAVLRRPHWVEGGHIIYVRQEESPGIWAQKVTDGMTPVGTPELIDSASAPISVSRRGVILWNRDASGEQRLVTVSREGIVREGDTIAQPRLTNPVWRGDGLAVAAALQEGVGKLWLHSLAGGIAPRPITVRLDSYDRYPVVSPSGHLLLYAADRDARRYLVLTTMDRPNQEKIVDIDVIRGTFTADGEQVVYAKRSAVSGSDLWIAPARGEGEPRLLLDEPTGIDNPRVSPDNRWVAYVGERFNRPQILVRRLADNEGPWQLSPSSGEVPRWSADGSELFYIEGTHLMSVPVRTSGTFLEFDTPRLLFDIERLGLLRQEYDPLPDGSGFIMVEPLRTDTLADREALILLQGWRPSR